MTRRVLVFNPAAGSGLVARTLPQVQAAFELAGHRVELEPTIRPRHAVSIARRVFPGLGRDDAVVVVGGDGTLNEVVTGASEAGLLDGVARPCVGIVPAGTANVVARELGLPLDPVRAARRVARGRPRPFDVGTCTMAGRVRPFVLACGIGLSAEAVARVRHEWKRSTGRLAYVVAAVEATGGNTRGLRVDYEDAEGRWTENVPAASVVACNVRWYGGHARLVRDASATDGLLDLLLLPTTRLPAMLALGGLAHVAWGALLPGARAAAVRRARVRATRPIPVDVDAELAGETPIELGVVPAGIRLLAP